MRTRHLTSRLVFASILIVTMAFPWIVWAKLPPPEKVTLQLPGSPTEVLVDPEDTAMFDRLHRVFAVEPEHKGTSVEVQTYGRDPNDGSLKPFDRFLYVGDPHGANGYLDFIERRYWGNTYDGKWLRVSPDGETLMRKYLTRLESATKPGDAFLAASTISPTPQAQEVQVKLYYPVEKGSLLRAEVRKAVKKGRRLEEVVLTELLKGPQTKGLRSVVPSRASVEFQAAKIFEKRAVVYVAWRSDVEPSIVDLEILTWAIVNTLTELSYIESVDLSVVQHHSNGSIKQLVDAVFERDEAKLATQ